MIQTDLTMLPLWTLGYCILACVLVIPMVAWICEIGGQGTKKIFWDKFAQQILGLANVALAGLLFASSVPLSIHFQDVLAAIKNIFWLQISLGLAGLFVFFLFFYQISWKKYKKQKGLHLVLGGCTALLAKAAFWTGCYASLEYTQKTDLILKYPLFWTAVGLWFVLLGAAIAFACIGLYVLLKRNRDDFGRDYYRFALSCSFKSALIFFVLHFSAYLLPETTGWSLLAQNPSLSILLIFAAGIGAVTIFLWKRLAFHANPVSQKSAILLGLLTLYCFICVCLPLQATRFQHDSTPIQITITDSFSLLQKLQNTP